MASTALSIVAYAVMMIDLRAGCFLRERASHRQPVHAAEPQIDEGQIRGLLLGQRQACLTAASD